MYNLCQYEILISNGYYMYYICIIYMYNVNSSKYIKLFIMLTLYCN